MHRPNLFGGQVRAAVPAIHEVIDRAVASSTFLGKTPKASSTCAATEQGAVAQKGLARGFTVTVPAVADVVQITGTVLEHGC